MTASTAPQPKTAADLLALPVRGEFGQREILLGGKRVIIPVAPQPALAFYTEPDTVFCATDAQGEGWILSMDADGLHRRRA